MRLDGSSIARQLLQDQQASINQIKTRGNTPHLAVILVGDDPASVSYVNQKVKKGTEIGMLVTVHRYNSNATTEQLLKEITVLNNDPMVHGIIVQQPLPAHINTKELVLATKPQKDVDGFHPESPFSAPIAEAVIVILKDIFEHRSEKEKNFAEWLSSKNIAVVGKGETGGGPIIQKFRFLGIIPEIIDSKTQEPEAILKNADIIVSCIGKAGILKTNELKKGSILIGVGMHRGTDGKLHADYKEDDIKDIVAYYTPVPGGMGPVNVACLLQNVVNAAQKPTHG